jgi:hypothetical protein
VTVLKILDMSWVESLRCFCDTEAKTSPFNIQSWQHPNHENIPESNFRTGAHLAKFCNQLWAHFDLG